MTEEKLRVVGVVLRVDQWELIVMALDRIRQMAHTNTEFTIDQLCRDFMRRRCVEIIEEITTGTGVAAK